MSGIFNRKNLVPLLAAWLMLADISAKSVKETNTQPSPNVVNELFEGYLVNRQHDALYHHILKDIDLKRNSAAIPGIALCSVKRADQGKSSDREAFMKAIASVVNRINGIVLDHRLFVIAVRDKTRAGIKLTEKENKKFQLICLFYQSNDIRALLEKIGPVSVSLAVAQASLESGFGSNEILHR
ncbi:MAG: hypothetical protein LBT67_00840, partial [Holosporaceae bacterium]|nr:hypothetical protein [Holosporaceae bacterium]